MPKFLPLLLSATILSSTAIAATPAPASYKLAEPTGKLDYQFSTEEQAKIKALEDSVVKEKPSVTDKRNLEINQPTPVASTTPSSGAVGTVPNSLFKEASPASAPEAGNPPLYKTLSSANAAGINPLASAPKIGTAQASDSTVTAPDLVNEPSFMDRIQNNLVQLIIGLALILGGVWVYLRKE